MKRRIVTIIVALAALTLAVSLTACGSSGSQSKEWSGEFDTECPVVGTVGGSLWQGDTFYVMASLSVTNIDKSKLNQIKGFSIYPALVYKDKDGNVMFGYGGFSLNSGSNSTSYKIDDTLLKACIDEYGKPSEVEVYISSVVIQFKDNSYQSWGFEGSLPVSKAGDSDLATLMKKGKLIGSTRVK